MSPPVVEFLTQNSYRIPDIDVTQVERRKAEAHQIRRPKIADDTLTDELLNEGIAIYMGKRDVTAPALGLPR